MNDDVLDATRSAPRSSGLPPTPGGSPIVSSSIGLGALLRQTVRIPDPRGASASGAQKRELHLLVVEDDPAIQHMIGAMLPGEFHIDSVPSAESALRQIKTATYDGCIIDIRLAGERDGMELIDRLREESAYRDTPMLAVTAYGQPGDEQRFIEAGFDGYLAKPFTESELLEAIQALWP